MLDAMRSHIDSLDASLTLLVEANAIVGSSLDFVVAGGWSPYLLCDHGGRHPGTRDVDLLFNVAVSTPSLRDLLKTFQENGYYRSAKHDFQFLRHLQIGESEFIFNVDFLHPKETVDSATLFIDHIEWPEYSDRARDRHFTMKSIALPSAQLVFEHNLLVDFEIKGFGENGIVRIIDELGLVVTKLSCYQKAKRERDCYDIYLAVSRPRNQTELFQRTKDLRQKDAKLDALLLTFADELAKSAVATRFNKAVEMFGVSIHNPSDQICSFLKETS